MRYKELLTEQQLDEINRRDFLKGAGAAVLTATLPGMAPAQVVNSQQVSGWTVYMYSSKIDGKWAAIHAPNTKPFVLSVHDDNSLGLMIGINLYPGKSVAVKFDNDPVLRLPYQEHGQYNKLATKALSSRVVVFQYQRWPSGIFEEEINLTGLPQAFKYAQKFVSSTK